MRGKLHVSFFVKRCRFESRMWEASGFMFLVWRCGLYFCFFWCSVAVFSFVRLNFRAPFSLSGVAGLSFACEVFLASSPLFRALKRLQYNLKLAIDCAVF